MLQATFTVSSDSKHDEKEFTGLNIAWVGTILDGIFWNFLGGSYPGWEFSRWECSRWELSSMGIFRVGIVRMRVILDGNCPGGSYPECEFSLVGVFLVVIV